VAALGQATVVAVDGYAVAVPVDADGPGPLQQDDTPPEEVVLQGGRHLRVFEGQNLLAADDQGDLGAERREHVHERDARDAGTDHDQVLGDLRRRVRLARGQDPRTVGL